MKRISTILLLFLSISTTANAGLLKLMHQQGFQVANPANVCGGELTFHPVDERILYVDRAQARPGIIELKFEYSVEDASRELIQKSIIGAVLDIGRQQGPFMVTYRTNGTSWLSNPIVSILKPNREPLSPTEIDAATSGFFKVLNVYWNLFGITNVKIAAPN